jgi:hypothetical protein
MTVNKRLDNLKRKINSIPQNKDVIVWSDSDNPTDLVDVTVCGKVEKMTLAEAERRFGACQVITWEDSE